MLGEVAAAAGTIAVRLSAVFDRWTDNAAAAVRFAELKALSDPLRTSGITLFVLTFIAGPAMYYSPWRPSLPGVLIYFVILFTTWMFTVWDYSVCRQRLLNEAFSCGSVTWACSFCRPLPPCDRRRSCSRDGLAAFHPLAAAARSAGRTALPRWRSP